jgi:hypothetical protein
MLKMFGNILFFVSFGMMLLERTSKYIFVYSMPEDQDSLGSLVFVSAVSILFCFNIIFN